MLRIEVEGAAGSLRLNVAFRSDARVTALFGRSGSGKTTLVNMIAGLRRPDRGRIEVDGSVLFDSAERIDHPPWRRRIGYVFQEGRLFPHFSVRSNLLYGSHLVPPPERRIGFDAIVTLLGLADLLERRPAHLSGGEKQRVAIGRALLSNPKLLLLDEPLAGLDGHRKDEILRYIELMRDEVGVPVVYVSHSVEEVLRLADDVVVLADGTVSAFGGVEEVMGRPELHSATGLFEGGSVIDAKVVAQDVDYDLATLAFDGGELTVTNLDALLGEPVRLRVRARDVSIALEAPRAVSIQNVLRATISSLGPPHSGIVTVTMSVGNVRLRARVTQRAVDQLGLESGKRVYALVKAVSLDRERGARA
jgi:molybdate transport system ATP-binding protein